jgi:hypothetical protein
VDAALLLTLLFIAGTLAAAAKPSLTVRERRDRTSGGSSTPLAAGARRCDG